MDDIRDATVPHLIEHVKMLSTELTKLRERVAWLGEAHRLDCDDLTNSRRILSARIDDLEGDVRDLERRVDR